MVKKVNRGFVFGSGQGSSMDKTDFVSAQSISKTQLEKEGRNRTNFESGFSGVKTGHGTPATEHLKERDGPVEI